VILIVAVAAAVVIGLMRGGRLAGLAGLRIAHGWLVLAAVALQYPLVYNLVSESAIFGVPLAFLMMALSFVLALYVTWANRRLPGLPLVGLGLLANLLAVTLNGGWMPVTPEAVEQLGYLSWVTPRGNVAKVWGAKNVVLPRAETRLWWLSDIFVVGAPFPVPSAFSIGDVLVAAGLFWLIQNAMVSTPEAADAVDEAGAGR
jgi:hypothetical protein